MIMGVNANFRMNNRFFKIASMHDSMFKLLFLFKKIGKKFQPTFVFRFFSISPFLITIISTKIIARKMTPN